MTSSQQSLLTNLREAIVKDQAQLGHAFQTLTALEREMKQEPSSEEIDRKRALHLEGTRWNTSDGGTHWIFLSGSCYFGDDVGKIGSINSTKMRHVFRLIDSGDAMPCAADGQLLVRVPQYQNNLL